MFAQISAIYLEEAFKDEITALLPPPNKVKSQVFVQTKIRDYEIGQWNVGTVLNGKSLRFTLGSDLAENIHPYRLQDGVAGDSLQFEADKASEEESLFTMPPGQETSPKSPLGESIFESQPLNPILDDDCSSTCGFPTQKSFTMASCASESHSHWLHIPIECTELDLQMFSSSPSCTGSETLGGNTAENSEDRLEFNMPFEVPSD
ncbi:tumor necrosis factor receptor superfamily member 27-like [Acinonyx jubatus]|uniref:Tumor necrosis factor receptor superfamily member 27-like n=1 Tax=Acinonyx jubatus TaxID=32536 RepID=A0A6J1YY50_ACIJB|nr:tumor necrosis factor receptor superfamily member 27-like [Acinonyx jubatus]